MSQNHHLSEYDEIVEMLILKTQHGRVPWQRDGSHTRFIAVLPGKRVFKMSNGPNGPSLTVCDSTNCTLIEVTNRERVIRLYEWAETIATHVDSGSTVEALRRL